MLAVTSASERHHAADSVMEIVENAILRSAAREKPPRAGAEEADFHTGSEYLARVRYGNPYFMLL